MIPTRIGQHFEGGYLAGVIRVRDCAYLILVAPKFTEGSVRFKTTYSSTARIQSVNDGWANTNAMNDSVHPAAHYCRSVNVNGYADLYLPSCDELELCYRVFNPTNWRNATYTAGTFPSNLSLANGTNRSSIPTGAAYTETNPTQTIVTAFREGRVEAFDTSKYYWTSTEYSSTTRYSLIQHFFNGIQGWDYKTNVYRVRCVRRILIDQAARGIDSEQIKSQHSKVHLTRVHFVRELSVCFRSILARILQLF